MIELGNQLTGISAVPLKLMVLDGLGPPNPVPLIVIVVFITPEEGDRLWITGAVWGVVLNVASCRFQFGSVV